jgi:Tol biopolymer transport system component
MTKPSPPVTALSPRAAASPLSRVWFEKTTTWFEEVTRWVAIAPDGKRALYASGKLIDLTTGRVDTELVARGMDGPLSGAVFGPGGRILRHGKRGGETGWFEIDAPARFSGLPGDAANPAWSPDAGRVAFTRRGGSSETLFVGGAAEPKAHTFRAPIMGYTWGPDGAALFVLTRGDSGASTLERLSPESGAIEGIAKDLDAATFRSAIAISPDGRVAYLALVGEGAPDDAMRHRPAADRDLDIYAVDLATGARTIEVRAPGDDFGPAVVGKHLYWMHNVIQQSIAVVPSSGGESRGVLEDASMPTWSSKGDQLGFVVGAWRLADWALNLDAGVIDVDADVRSTSAPRPIVTGYHEDFSPSWSPDGRWIVYHSHRSREPLASPGAAGSSDDLYIRRPAAPMSDEVRLTDFGAEVGMADWAPDGARLVFASGDKGGPHGASRAWIVSIDPATGRVVKSEPLRVPETVREVAWVAWSPKGDEIAMEVPAGSNRHALWVVKADGSAAEKLIDYPIHTFGGLDWTADGGAIVYAALDGDRMQILTIPRSGGAPRTLTRDSSHLFMPQVSPDGRWIAVSRLETTKEIQRKVLAD